MVLAFGVIVHALKKLLLHYFPIFIMLLLFLTAAKTPKTAKKSAKTPARSIKKSVKKRTWADVAKKTPAPKAKTSLTSKMAAHVQKQQRRKSGQALPTFRMVREIYFISVKKKFKTYFIMLFKNVVINLYYYLGCSQKLQLCQDVENWSCFIT